MNSMIFFAAILFYCFMTMAAAGGAATCSTINTPLVLNQVSVGNLKIDSFEATDGSELKLSFDADLYITNVALQDVPRVYDFSANPVKSVTINHKLPCLGTSEYWVRLTVVFLNFSSTPALVNVKKIVGCHCADGVPACQEFTDYLWTDFPQLQAATIKTTSVESSSGSTVTMSIDALNSRKFQFIQVQQGVDTMIQVPFTAPFPTKTDVQVGQILCNTTTLVPYFSEYGLKVVMYSVNLQFADNTWARGDVPKQVLCKCL